MKKAYYYSHDSNMWNDPKIIKIRRKHGIVGYGIFNHLCELLNEAKDNRLRLDEDSLDDLVFDFQDPDVNRDMLEDIILHYGLFEREEKDDSCGYFYSKRMRRNIAKMEDIKQKRSYAGQMSGKARQVINTSSTPVKQNPTMKGKESKVKEIKLKESKIKTLDSVESNGNVTLIQYFGNCFKNYFGNDYHANFGKDGKLLKLLSDQYGDDRVRKGIQYFFNTYLVQDEFAMENPNVGTLSIKWNSMIARSSGKKALTKQQKKIQSSIENILEVDLD